MYFCCVSLRSSRLSVCPASIFFTWVIVAGSGIKGFGKAA